MKTYQIRFADKRKPNTFVEAKNKVEAIKLGRELFICGFVVYNN